MPMTQANIDFLFCDMGWEVYRDSTNEAELPYFLARLSTLSNTLEYEYHPTRAKTLQGIRDELRRMRSLS